jgi:adenylate kinase
MNLIIFGPQGSGKGTQADKLTEKFGLFHIETGQIFREIARENSQLGKKILDLNNRKEMIPDEITIEVLENYIKKASEKEGIILDSAPRTIGQIELVENMLETFGRKIDKAIYITLPYEESIARITKRYACTLCYRHFVLGKDIDSEKNSCPTCGGFIAQRGDDTPDGIAKRLKTFYAVTMPVVEHYRKKDMLIEVDGNQQIEKVFGDIINKF